MIAEFPLDVTNAILGSITAGPDGALWFTASYFQPFSDLAVASRPSGPFVGRITTTGAATIFTAGLGRDSTPEGITTGADGNLWFVDSATNHVDRITTAGVLSPFAIPSGNSGATSITAGPDDNLWFNEETLGQVGQVVLPQSVIPTGQILAGVAGVPLTDATFAKFSDRSSLVDLGRFFFPIIAFGDGTYANGALVAEGMASSTSWPRMPIRWPRPIPGPRP